MLENNKSVLITGTSTGIGKVTALLFDKFGYKVFACVRKEEDAINLKSEASDNLVTLIMDVTDEDSIKNAVESVKSILGDQSLFALINNAGISVSGPLEFVELSRVKHQLLVNIVGQLAVTQAFLPMLRESKGRIVNLSSVCGLVPLPLYGPYCASKFGLEAMTSSLRLELRESGIKVVLIQPGFISTPFWDKSLDTAKSMTDNLSEKAELFYGKMIEKSFKFSQNAAKYAIAPQEVAQVIFKAVDIDDPKKKYMVGKGAKFQAFARFIPSQFRDIAILKYLDLLIWDRFQAIQSKL